MKATAGTARLLDVRQLSVRFFGDEGIVTAVDDVSFALSLGKILCLLGESGCGKTVTMRPLMRLLPITARCLVPCSLMVSSDMLHEWQLQAIRGSTVAMVFQDPMSALDPVFTIGQQITEVVVAHEGVSRATAQVRALELLEMVQIPSAKAPIGRVSSRVVRGLRRRDDRARAFVPPKVAVGRRTNDGARCDGSNPNPHIVA